MGAAPAFPSSSSRSGSAQGRLPWVSIPGVPRSPAPALALSTNLAGHFADLYEVYSDVPARAGSGGLALTVPLAALVARPA